MGEVQVLEVSNLLPFLWTSQDDLRHCASHFAAKKMEELRNISMVSG